MGRGQGIGGEWRLVFGFGWDEEGKADEESGMQDAERLDYRVNDEPAGVWTSARNLTYVKVRATRLPQTTYAPSMVASLDS